MKTKTITVKKGEEMNKLLLMRELMRDCDDLFETVVDDEASIGEKFFGGGKKIVSKQNFKAKLLIKTYDEGKD